MVVVGGACVSRVHCLLKNTFDERERALPL